MAEIIRGLRPDEHLEALDLWDTVFQETPRSFFVPYFEKDPWQKDEYTRVCEVDGRIVAGIHLCCRPVESPFGLLKLAGIANVATRIEYRGHGYSSKLLQDAIRIMEQEDFDFSVLFTGINDFYARLGWVTVPCGLVKGKLDLSHPVAETRVSVSTTPPAIEELIPIYQSFNAARPVAVKRTPEYWEWVIAQYGACRWLTVRESGRLIAYAVILTEQAELNIREYGWYLEHEDSAVDLTRAIAAQAKAGALGEILAIVPAEPAFMNGLKAAGIDATQSAYHSAMFRRVNIDPEKFKNLCDLMVTAPAVMWAADHF